jgi:RNA polymerase sigma factor (sigma-70 family)
MMEHSDAAVISASIEEPAAFAAVFERHFPAIHGYLRRRVGHNLAEDLAGQVFTIAFDRRATFVPAHDTARPWLLGIATNLVHRHLRDEERKTRAVEALFHRTMAAADPFGDVDSRLDAIATAAGVRGALAGLPVADRDALVLFAVEGLSYEDVATALGTPIGTVRSRIHRARSRLRAIDPASGKPTSCVPTEGV